jgi:hypothetical protein
MVRRGRRFESARGLEIPANRRLLLPGLIVRSTSLFGRVSRSFALKELTAAAEAKIGALVK